jgi:hypothetical protein
MTLAVLDVLTVRVPIGFFRPTIGKHQSLQTSPEGSRYFGIEIVLLLDGLPSTSPQRLNLCLHLSLRAGRR